MEDCKKEVYEKPVVEITEFQTEDVITTSGEFGGSEEL